MVYTRSNKISKVSYTERVLGAFTQVQKDHRKHAVHLATIRAQVKKTAQAKKDKLGPQWSHWVGKAINKLENEGILEPASPSGTVALTAGGKQAISRARRSIVPHVNNDFSPAQEHLVWKQVVSGASKRARATSVENYPGSTSATPRKKRAKLSESPKKKSISRMTKAELKAELDWLREHAQVHDLLRGVSPLTDLDDEEEVQNVRLREELKEREEEIEQMRRKLSAARAARYRAVTDDEDDEPDVTFRPMTPDTTIEFPHGPSQRTAAAAPSQVYPRGLMRTQSGSYISNLSKQPTPAPSSPDRDISFDDIHTDDGPFGLTEYPDNGRAGLRLNQDGARRISFRGRNADGYKSSAPDNRLMQGAFPATPQSHVDKRSRQDQEGVISTLKTEIDSLREQLNAKTTTLSNRETEVKALSDRAARLESVILTRDATISDLREANSRLSAEVTDHLRSWKQAEDTVVKTAEQLAAVESSFEVLKREKGSVVDRLVLLETSNKELRLEKDTLINTIGQLKQQEADLKTSKGQLEIRISGLIEELGSQKKLSEELQAEIVNLNERHSTDLRLARQKNDDLENTVSTYRTEVEEKGLSIESLGNELKAKDLRIEDLSTKLREMGKSADDLAARFSGAQSTVTLLSQDLVDAKQSAKTLQATLEATIAELESEVAQRQQITAKLSEKEMEIGLERGNATQLRGYIEELKVDLVTKERHVQQLSEELNVVRGQVTSLEESLATSTQAHRAEREQMSTQLSNLEAIIASAKIDLADSTARLTDATSQLMASKSELEKKNADLNTLSILLQDERQEKSRLAADLDNYIRKTHDLQDDLREYEVSKVLDEATISNMRQSFASIRDSQMRIFGELEEKIASAQPSPSLRRKSSNISMPSYA